MELTEFALETLKDRYLLDGETPEGMFKRVAKTYSDSDAHSNRLYSYMADHWFMPATPILANGGTNRGLPISCFLNETQDSLKGIVDLWDENVWLASGGGGIGSYWGNLRHLGAKVGTRGETCGIIPFIKVMDSMTLAISQGSLRRGSAAVYLPIHHPEIEEFLDLRRPTGGDPNRKALNIHHAVVVSDAFMICVENDLQFTLRNPKDNYVVKEVNARNLWIKLLTSRIETGEPYILFEGSMLNGRSEVYKAADIYPKTSNLCIEIMLATGLDKHKKERTAVCCLSSVNLEYYDKWKKHETFIEDVLRFLDNVLSDFITNAPKALDRAKYAAIRERSVGLGVMGFHSYLQSRGVSFEGAIAKSNNLRIFRHIKEQVDKANLNIGLDKGACPDAKEAGLEYRFANCTAIAPTASISIICGTTSAGIDPWLANIFTHKTLSGSYTVKNKYLTKLLESKGENTDKTWSKIIRNEGSVQDLDCLTDDEKEVFKTALEINPYWIIEHAADRTPFIDQSQSVNLWLPANVEKKDLHNIHWQAWKKGLKSLYYCRSTTIQPAEKISKQIKYEECLSCT